MSIEQTFGAFFCLRIMETSLRTLSHKDIFQMAILADNKKVSDSLKDLFPHPYSEEDATSFIDLCIQHNPQQNFAIEHHGAFCGVIGLIPQDDVYRKSAEIGYWLGEPYWGKGIATKAVRLVTDYGFKELGFARIQSGIFEYNPASMRVLEKNGYQKEGVFIKSVFKNNRYWDEHRYYKLNPTTQFQ